MEYKRTLLFHLERANQFFDKKIFVIKSAFLLNLFCTLAIIIELYGSNSTTETTQKKQFNLKIYPLEKRNNLFLALLLHFRYIEAQSVVYYYHAFSVPIVLYL